MKVGRTSINVLFSSGRKTASSASTIPILCKLVCCAQQAQPMGDGGPLTYEKKTTITIIRPFVHPNGKNHKSEASKLKRRALSLKFIMVCQRAPEHFSLNYLRSIGLFFCRVLFNLFLTITNFRNSSHTWSLRSRLLLMEHC